jgi:hypothetical protein
MVLRRWASASAWIFAISESACARWTRVSLSACASSFFWVISSPSVRAELHRLRSRGGSQALRRRGFGLLLGADLHGLRLQLDFSTSFV